MPKISKKELKENAQRIIMHSVAISCSKVYEGDEGHGMTDEEKEELMIEIVKQANRVAKLMGFEKCWMY